MATRPGRGNRPERRSRHWPPFDLWHADARLAIRSLARRPGFTATAIVTLALGVGAAISVFSIVNQVLLRPMPGVQDPDRLALVEFPLEGSPGRRMGLSVPDFEDLRSGARTLDGMATYVWIPSMQVLPTDGAAFEVSGHAVAGDYFGVLGVRPLLGRLITADEATYGIGSTVAVLGERLWRRSFNADPDVVGRAIHVNGNVLTIVGVVGGGFHGVEKNFDIELWVPVSAYPSLRHVADRSRYLERGQPFFRQLLVRRAPGTSVEHAQSDLDAGMARIMSAYPEANEHFERYKLTVYDGLGLDPFARDRTASTLRLLFAIVLLVLLIACANVANLLMFRGVYRRGEAAVRRALGASTLRLIRQQFMESVLLGAAGAVAGLVVALLFTRAFHGLSLVRAGPVGGLALDERMLAFILAAALITPIVFGTVPTLLGSRVDAARSLRGASGREVGRHSRLRTVLSIVQLGLSLTLLVGTLLVVRTLQNLQRVNVGFDVQDVFTFSVDPGPQGYSPEQVTSFRRRLVDRARALPGVQSAALVYYAPFWGARFLGSLRRPGGGERDVVEHDMNWITNGYTDVLRLPIVHGRAFRQEDMADGATNVLVSESLAQALFGTSDAVDRHVETTPTAMSPAERLTIVGVVADARFQQLEAPPGPMLFQPMPRTYRADFVVAVRSALSPAQLDRMARELVASIDPAIPVGIAAPLTTMVAERLSERRLIARLLGTFSVFAVVLAGIGLYGLVGHAVAQRTRELGLRMALGAHPTRLVLLVLRQSLGVAAVGVLLGIAGSLAFARAVENRLFGVQPLDPPTYLAAVAVLVAAAVLAGLLPARAATRVDPGAALRHD